MHIHDSLGPIRSRMIPILLIGALALLSPSSGKAAPGLMPIAGKPAAQDFALSDLDGRIHRLSDYRGKVVLVTFWATWCPPCRKEMPAMQRVWEKLRDKGFVILALDVGQDEETILPFVMEHDLDFPILMDKDSNVSNQWPVRGLPPPFWWIPGAVWSIEPSAVGSGMILFWKKRSLV